MADTPALKDLIVQLQDGSRIHLERNDDDQLVTTGFDRAAQSAYGLDAVVPGHMVVGFGPWPTWSSNTSSRTATLPDDESGLFEPERLFVLREQYMFLAEGPTSDKPRSVGPIHKAWWVGTEGVVQAHVLSGRATTGKPSNETHQAQGEMPRG